MTTITKEIRIDMGHAVTNHSSKCKGIHGHSYSIIATCEGSLIGEGSSEGMVIDFGDLKQVLMHNIDARFDHGFVLWKGDPRAELLAQATELWSYDKSRFHLVDFIPTAENLARYWYELIVDELRDLHKIQLVSLTVFETPTSAATYTRED